MGLLRVLLAVSVFMAHVPKSGLTPILSGFGGPNAVEIFFLVSGFYIALILEKSYSSRLSFYMNRILRLFPIYYIICGLVLIQAFLLPNLREYHFSFPAQALIIGTIANLTFLGSDWLFFLQWQNANLHLGNIYSSELPLHQMLLVPQSWSIGIEITFYLLAPMFCKAKTHTIAVAAICLLTVRFIGLFFEMNQDPWTYRFFPFELPMFLIGILLFRLRIYRENASKISLSKIYPVLITFYVGFSYLTNTFIINRFWQMIPLITIACIVIMWGEETSKDKKLGDLSYPIYMSHILVISTYNGIIRIISKKIDAFELLNSPLLVVPITLVITVIFSFLLLRFVQPIEKIRDKNRVQMN
jgi:peptidoglycan/LPS O-acetylase OafA/YrhL